MTRAGIQEPRSPGTDRSESVPDNKNSVGPGPVLDFEDYLGPGPEPTGFGPWIPGHTIMKTENFSGIRTSRFFEELSLRSTTLSK